MSRNRLFVIAGALAVAAVVCLVTGIILLQKNIASYVAGHYHEYARDVNGTRYQCTGSPEQVADTLSEYAEPAARADDNKTEYLRYSNDIVIVGPDGNYPCSIRVEPLSAG